MSRIQVRTGGAMLALVLVFAGEAHGSAASAGTCSGVADDVAEDNDTCDASQEIGAGHLAGLVVSKQDDDWFQLTVPTFTTAYVQVLFSDAQGDIDLRRFDGCGGALVAASVSRTDHEQLAIAATHTPVQVRFLVEMFDADPSDCNTYDLVVSFEPGTPGVGYCPAQPNSSGFTGRIVGNGSSSVSAADLTLVAGPIPSGVPGLFFHGNRQALLPFGNGVRCVKGQVRRSQVMAATGTNLLWSPTATTVPQIQQGVTRHFQCWFRDGGQPQGFGLTSGYTVTFTQ